MRKSLLLAFLVLAACGDSGTSADASDPSAPDAAPFDAAAFDGPSSCRALQDEYPGALAQVGKSCETIMDCALVGGQAQQSCDGVPASCQAVVELLDLPVLGNLGGRGDRWSNLNLRALHVGEPACPLAFSDPGIILLHEILLSILDGICRLHERGFTTGIRLARVICSRLAGDGAPAVLHRISLMLGKKRRVGPGHGECQ